MSFKFDDTLSQEEQAFELQAFLAEIMLPRYLRTASFKMASRNLPYFFSLRASILPESTGFFDYWDKCTHENDYAHA